MALRDIFFQSFDWWDVQHTWRWVISSTYFDKGRLLNYSILTRSETLDMIMQYLGFDPDDVQHEKDDTIGCHARFEFLERLYKYHMDVEVEVDDDDAHKIYHIICALRSYLLYLVGMSMFVDKSAYYVDVVYLRYFIDLGGIHEYNWGNSYLVYMYS